MPGNEKWDSSERDLCQQQHLTPPNSIPQSLLACRCLVQISHAPRNPIREAPFPHELQQSPEFINSKRKNVPSHTHTRRGTSIICGLAEYEDFLRLAPVIPGPDAPTSKDQALVHELLFQNTRVHKSLCFPKVRGTLLLRERRAAALDRSEQLLLAHRWW